ncbi:MAG: calcium-translocating P-type ATPase, PMCA-type [Gemmataceae bacterium]|nr:calcium-translocating P-type ATPase, PMCA-type [Gemmataceae bacterium]MDW8267330.1 calcium-translocating P-type ATPase, PMCA-type [Gemmataceae bacterium]
MPTLAELEQELGLGGDTGLSPQAVVKSRQRYGVNRLTPLPREPLWKKFLAKFDEPIIQILLTATLLSIVVDWFQHAVGVVAHAVGGLLVGLVAVGLTVAAVRGRRRWVPSGLLASALLLWPAGWLTTGHASIDGLAVMVAVVLATGVAFLSEYRSDRAFEILNAHKEALQVKVLRAGEFATIPLEDVVVGDLVVLEAGDEVPADGCLLKATDLSVDQSLMTGESEPVAKYPLKPSAASAGIDPPHVLYRGTQVVEGIGQMVVTAVGDATVLGQLARRLAAPDDDPRPVADEERRVHRKLTLSREFTPLQQKLAQLASLISKVGYAAAGAIFAALLVRGLWLGEIGRSAGFLASAGAVLDYFMYMVIIIVVAVPEGLPMSVTVSLALAMRQMTQANSLVRQLVACETIGSATVICSDKTGTLTQNQMRVVRIDVAAATLAAAAAPRAPAQPHTPLDWIALNAAVNSTANLEARPGGWQVVGNSTEGALLRWLADHALDYRRLRLQFEPLYRIHFSSERKRMTTVVGHAGRLLVLVKGAPEGLLAQCDRFLDQDGSVRPLTPEFRAAVQAALREAASAAMRTLAFAHAVLPEDTPDDADALHARRDHLDHGLIWTGFVAIRDPLRPEVPDALAECRRAGIDVKMVTGDNIETARAIGREIGLLDRPDNLVLTSEEFNALTDDELSPQLPRLRILARAKPLDKLRLVRLLQERHEVVAVTGDGTNDAPALKRADVGLAMGRAGTEVAKEASKIVLLDDSFATIVKAVHWGRALYENIQRFLQFQLTINVSALAIAFLGPFVGVKPPFTVLQLLWINVIMDTLAAIALCSEPPRPGLMTMPPKRRDDDILTRPMRQTIALTAAFFVVVMIGLLLGMERLGWFAGPGPAAAEFPGLTVRQVSIFFTVYVLFQVWNEINCRSLVPEVSGLSGLCRNRVFLAIVGLIVAVQVLIVSTPMGRVFQVEPLALSDWLVMGAATSSVLVFAEVTRRLRLRRRAESLERST